MKRTYISPEFDYKPIYGCYVMSESVSYFGSKMMEIEDVIEITNENLIYNQLVTGEQIDEASELNLPQIFYDTTINKQVNHSLELDLEQTPFELENSAKWVFKIDVLDILRNHLFALLKKNRTFEGVKKNYVRNGDVDSAIFDYINRNIISRYTYVRTDLYVEYVDLCGDGTLQYKNEYNFEIESPSNKTTKFQGEITPDGRYLTINFTQEKPAFNYSYKYYFNIFFEKL